MLSYALTVLAVLALYNPIIQLLSSEPSSATTATTLPPQIRRTPRPQVNETLLALELTNGTALKCPEDLYSVHIFSKEPLVVYIENFLSADERSHLLEIR